MMHQLDVVILVFDTTSLDSLNHIAALKRALLSELGDRAAPIFLVAGTKSDLYEKQNNNPSVVSCLFCCLINITRFILQYFSSGARSVEYQQTTHLLSKQKEMNLAPGLPRCSGKLAR